MDAVGQISMNVRVGLLSVMRMLPVTILMVAFTASVTLDTLEVVILENALVWFFECNCCLGPSLESATISSDWKCSSECYATKLYVNYSACAVTVRQCYPVHASMIRPFLCSRRILKLNVGEPFLVPTNGIPYLNEFCLWHDGHTMYLGDNW